MKLNRLIIHPKDVQRITGKSDRYGRCLLKKIRAHFSKEGHQFISDEEFCSYTGLKYEHVSELL